ncbi:NBS-LRR resistance protein [Quillaja saponaria]|uniref:NBS-LRR resistance protein n=1 Tax=Quillaja saponaria TaxID=32244 RepID=A0AAD7L0W8_QUISA|nr:NBS-LRR resistance protein [Quillaja saponaria]
MAGALVGGAFLSAFVQVAFDRLASPKILDYFQEKNLDFGYLKKLNSTLTSIYAVLDYAEEKQIGNPLVKRWVNELKDAVFDAEDLLDEIDTEVAQQEQEAELLATSSKVRNLSSTVMASTSVHPLDSEIELRIKQVLDNLEYLEQRKHVLRLEEHGMGVGAEAFRKLSQRLPTTSLVDETNVYGRTDDKEAIISLLFSDGVNGSCLSVIAIVAMGGIGKTTLAQLVYNDERVIHHFDLKAWIFVSEEFDVISLTKTILQALNITTTDFESLDMLQLKLQDRLAKRKFLIVLDDVWNENRTRWEALQFPFNYGAPGSKILVTTRSERVSEVMLSISIHQLKQLGEEDGWKLFEKHAFNNRDSSAYPNLKATGRKIVDKCKGLPLAIKTLGGLLFTKSSEEEWDMILRSDIWNFSDDESNIIPALRLSYCYLPSHLKQCFSYCSIFPKNFRFQKMRLILFWMAEGLLQDSTNKTMEEVGEEYFHDLTTRSFFQLSDIQAEILSTLSG